MQVPSLGYVRNIVESFGDDQTWGEKISVSQDTKMFPVFMENLPQLTSEELKALLVKAMAAPSKLNPGGTKVCVDIMMTQMHTIDLPQAYTAGPGFCSSRHSASFTLPDRSAELGHVFMCISG